MTQDARVVCAGAATVDYLLRSEQRVERATSNPGCVVRSFGGVARNVAENLARLGIGVALRSAVGNDDDGARVLASLRACGVDVRDVDVMPRIPTAAYLAVLEPGGDLYTAGCDARILDGLVLSDRTRAALGRAEWLFIDGNVPAALLGQCADLRSDAAWRLALDATSLAKARRLPADLAFVDLLFVNEDEAGAVEGSARATVMTRGAGGLSLFESGVRTEMDASAADVVDVTGAGDALVAGTLFGLLRGDTLEAALRAGLHVAALTVARAGSVRYDLTAAMLA